MVRNHCAAQHVRSLENIIQNEHTRGHVSQIQAVELSFKLGGCSHGLFNLYSQYMNKFVITKTWYPSS
jgi:hypothetical protein